jgi:3-hydroxyacyl-CoA dehydrogenase
MSPGTAAQLGTKSSVIRAQSSEGVGLLIIDNPPVNASSSAVRQGLLDGVGELSANPDVSAIVIIGAAANFISGSDLTEFSSPIIPPPELPQLIAAIRETPKPVVAAISGSTLGGGLELALSCDYRVASRGTVVGLPETTLGMIPGAGGTQLALHLLGPGRAVALAASGRRYEVTDPAVQGLVDLVVDQDLETAAIDFARSVSAKRGALEEPIPEFAAGEFEAAARKAISAGRGRPQIIAAVGAVLAGLALPPEKALTHERAEFTRLRNGDESAALRHVFFARRAVAKANRPVVPVALQRVAVVGSGTMGRGIARAFVDHGMNVVLHDERAEALDGARQHLEDAYRKQAAGSQITAEEAQARIDRLAYAPNIESLAGADLYIEAVFEDIAVKTGVLRRLESVAAGAIIATNTSYLDIELLADAVESPDRLLGLHFFSPAHRTPVVEVVYGRRTAQPALNMAFTAAKALGKVAIRAAVGEGFIGNRIFNAYRRQCELLLEEGALPAQVDAALRQFGFAMGPFAVADMSGLDIAWRMRQRTADFRDPAERYPDVADQLCERGWFGQKSGRGWYRYGDDGRTPISDPEVNQLIIESSARQGIERRILLPEDIVQRVLLAMANESALVLQDGIADRPSDIDLMMVLGYGFPDFRGGPTLWARQQDPAQLRRNLEELAEATGVGFRRGDFGLLGA